MQNRRENLERIATAGLCESLIQMEYKMKRACVCVRGCCPAGTRLFFHHELRIAPASASAHLEISLISLLSGR